MNKPIIFVLYISLACSIGFIGGITFGDHYKKNVVLETISQHDEIHDLMNWHQLIILDQLVLDDLEGINDMSGLESLKEKYKNNGLSHISLFREQANKLKEGAPNPTYILALEANVSDIEKQFNQKKP